MQYIFNNGCIWCWTCAFEIERTVVLLTTVQCVISYISVAILSNSICILPLKQTSNYWYFVQQYLDITFMTDLDITIKTSILSNSIWILPLTDLKLLVFCQ